MISTSRDWRHLRQKNVTRMVPGRIGSVVRDGSSDLHFPHFLTNFTATPSWETRVAPLIDTTRRSFGFTADGAGRFGAGGGSGGVSTGGSGRTARPASSAAGSTGNRPPTREAGMRC